jgi:protein tyrosine phosphatase
MQEGKHELISDYCLQKTFIFYEKKLDELKNPRKGTLTWIGTKPYNGFKVHTFTMMLQTGGKKSVTREVIAFFKKNFGLLNFFLKLSMMHFDDWDDHKVCHNIDGLCVAVLENEQLRDFRAGQGYPNMVVHCSAGLYRSPAFVAICLQSQWLSELNGKVVDPMAVMTHVRKYRLHAFESSTKNDEDFHAMNELDGRISPKKPLVMIITVIKASLKLMEWYNGWFGFFFKF